MDAVAVGLWSLFVGAFLSATLLPGGSEVVLVSNGDFFLRAREQHRRSNQEREICFLMHVNRHHRRLQTARSVCARRETS